MNNTSAVRLVQQHSVELDTSLAAELQQILQLENTRRKDLVKRWILLGAKFGHHSMYLDECPCVDSESIGDIAQWLEDEGLTICRPGRWSVSGRIIVRLARVA